MKEKLEVAGSRRGASTSDPRRGSKRERGTCPPRGEKVKGILGRKLPSLRPNVSKCEGGGESSQSAGDCLADFDVEDHQERNEKSFTHFGLAEGKKR